MHPNVRRFSQGMCPECGMALVPERRRRRDGQHEDGSTHAPDKHAGHSVRMFARKFWVSLLLTVPVVLTSELADRLFGWQVADRPAARLAALLLGSVVFWYGGWVFLAGASRELQGRRPGMMTLIAIALVTAYAYSVAVSVSGAGSPLFWELTTLVTVMLLGHWVEMRAVAGAQGALRELSKLLPDTAEIVRGQETRVVPVRELREEDIVLVRPGGKIPADGVVTDGRSEVNEALVTGESKPAPKALSSEVIAGTVNGDGVLRVRVTKIGERTFLAGVMRLVADAQASKSRLQLLSDRAAFALTIIALVTGAVTLAVWLFLDAGIVFAVERVVSVLVIACPHALGLAVPLVASISTTRAARNGVLVRQRLALEAARTVDTVLFDKTGTLTKGEFGVEKVWAFPGSSASEVVQLAASVDVSSEHVVGKAIVGEAKRLGLPLTLVEEATAVPGHGMRGVLNGQPVAVGGFSLRGERGGIPNLPKTLEEEMLTENRRGKSIVLVWRGSEPIGALSLGDVMREESRPAVVALKRLKVRVAMVTGDSEDVARWVAKELQIDEYVARVRPEGKAEAVRRLQAQGHRVAFVGDGINDAPALAQADVGIAIGAGTNVAIESAGILLMRNDPRDIAVVLALSRATYAKMLQNLFWATAYNLVALPLAAGILVSRGIVLNPALSAVFMSLSTVIVAVNAVLLRRTPLHAARGLPLALASVEARPRRD